MKLSNTLAIAFVALFAAPAVTADLFAIEAAVKEVPSATRKKKHSGKKNIGKLVETYTTIYVATLVDDETVSGAELDGEAISYMGDNLLFTYNAVQTNSDLTGFGSHFAGEGEGPDDDEAARLFPELALEDDSSLPVTGGLGRRSYRPARRSSYRYSNYVFFYSFGCRLCGDDDSLVGDSDFIENWEEAFCDQLAGSGLAAFDGATGCRILQTDSAAMSQVGSA